MAAQPDIRLELAGVSRSQTWHSSEPSLELSSLLLESFMGRYIVPRYGLRCGPNKTDYSLGTDGVLSETEVTDKLGAHDTYYFS